MKTKSRTLREWVTRLRVDAVEHDGVLIYRPVPLFVIIACFLDDDILHKTYDEAVADGVGDPEDLNPGDKVQTSRLEAAILARTTDILTIRELLSIVW